MSQIDNAFYTHTWRRNAMIIEYGKNNDVTAPMYTTGSRNEHSIIVYNPLT